MKLAEHIKNTPNYKGVTLEQQAKAAKGVGFPCSTIQDHACCTDLMSSTLVCGIIEHKLPSCIKIPEVIDSGPPALHNSASVFEGGSISHV